MNRSDKPKRPSGRARPAPKPARQHRSEPASRENPRSEAETAEKLAKIAGLPAVTALFRSDAQRVMRLYYEESLKNAVGGFCAEMARLHRPYRLVSGEELAKIAGTVLHGGVVAAAIPQGVPELQLATAEQWARRGESMLILDGVGNPHNLGAIARTLAFFGLRHLVISDHPEQAAPSDAAYRVAEGGLDMIDVHRIRHLPRMLKKMQKFYLTVGTALSEDAAPLDRLARAEKPVALVLGNEEHGIPPQTLSACEAAVMIPGSGQIQSLNVSASASILVYELSKLRRAELPPGRSETGFRARERRSASRR